MRDATIEELESVDRYIKSISKPTGVNFFDLLDHDSSKALKQSMMIDKCDFRPQILGEFIPPIDCNDCKWLDLTEDEQQELGDRCHRHHFCTYYKKRVYHETNNLIHNPVLYPCKECEKEKREHFQNRSRE